MQFSDIPGLDELKSQLTSAFQKGKVAHAQLFAGSLDTAVLPITLAYASYIMCTDRTEHDSCGRCANCLRIKKLVHPDIHFYFPKVSASDSGKYDKVLAEALPKFRSFIHSQPYGNLEDWSNEYGQENKNLLISREDSRQILRNVSMRSVEGGYKILIIWHPELMNSSSANAILKILEEPPEKTIYLLASYNYDGLLSTITSRTQLIVVPPNNDEEIIGHLAAIGIDESKATPVTKQAEGRIGAALRFSQEEGNQEYETFQLWMQECWNKDLTSLIRRSEDFSKSGKSNQRTSLTFSIATIRNAVLSEGGQEPAVQSESEKTFVKKFANSLGMKRLERIYQILNESIHHLERNSNPRITHLNLSLDIIHVLNG